MKASRHFLLQRVTALGNLILIPLFLYFFLCAARLDYGAVMALFSSLPLVLLFGVMVVSLTLHGA
ncbi:MAG: hypothetical protein ACR2N8_03495, partial [Parvibaculales bacterium]